MVVSLYHLLKLRTQEIANRGHQGLESSEPETTDQSHMPRKPLGGQAFADGDREGIHGKAYGDE